MANMPYLSKCRRTLPFVVSIAVMAAVVTLNAQHPVFRLGVDLVSLNVTVMTNGGHYVNGLTMEDFDVLEDGRPQQLVQFSRAASRLSIAVLIDSSASMEPQMSLTQKAAVEFVGRLRPEDLAEVVDFDSRVEILQSFTSDRELLESAINGVSAGGTTSLYNAVYIALRHLEKSKPRDPDDVRRQVIVLLSDGEDTSSLVTFDEIHDVAKRSQAVIYSIALGTSSPYRGVRSAEGSFVLRQLATETGGRMFTPKQASELSGVYSQIADELANQYVLGYVSTNGQLDGSWRTISVRVRRPDAQPRTRLGYYASSRTAAHDLR